MTLLRALKYVLLFIVVAALCLVGLLYYQGQQEPRKNAPYVALGSSFAAGIGLGESLPGSPIVCQRSRNGYAQRLARLTRLTLQDMTCSGATIKHVLRGGQVFLGPQIDALGPDTQLVTLTAGGNDIDYVGDLVFAGYQRGGGITGSLIDLVWSGAQPVKERAFVRLEADMVATLREIRRRSPRAKVLFITYPNILPEKGSCPQIGITEPQAALMRSVGMRLVEVTGSAAENAGVTMVDLTGPSRGHDACSNEPWVNGAAPATGTAFHPNQAGAKAVAEHIKAVLGTHKL